MLDVLYSAVSGMTRVSTAEVTIDRLTLSFVIFVVCTTRELFETGLVCPFLALVGNTSHLLKMLGTGMLKGLSSMTSG